MECVAIGEVSFHNQVHSRVMLVSQVKMRVYTRQGTGLFIGIEIIGAAEHWHLLAWAHQLKMTIPNARPFTP